MIVAHRFFGHPIAAFFAFFSLAFIFVSSLPMKPSTLANLDASSSSTSFQDVENMNDILSESKRIADYDILLGFHHILTSVPPSAIPTLPLSTFHSLYGQTYTLVPGWSFRQNIDLADFLISYNAMSWLSALRQHYFATPEMCYELAMVAIHRDHVDALREAERGLWKDDVVQDDILRDFIHESRRNGKKNVGAYLEERRNAILGN